MKLFQGYLGKGYSSMPLIEKYFRFCLKYAPSLLIPVQIIQIKSKPDGWFVYSWQVPSDSNITTITKISLYNTVHANSEVFDQSIVK